MTRIPANLYNKSSLNYSEVYPDVRTLTTTQRTYLANVIRDGEISVYIPSREANTLEALWRRDLVVLSDEKLSPGGRVFRKVYTPAPGAEKLLEQRGPGQPRKHNSKADASAYQRLIERQRREEETEIYQRIAGAASILAERWGLPVTTDTPARELLEILEREVGPFRHYVRVEHEKRELSQIRKL